MTDVTCVVFVPRRERGQLRHALTTGDIGELRWQERRGLRGSEFYLTGPSALAMKMQSFITNWVAAKSHHVSGACLLQIGG